VAVCVFVISLLVGGLWRSAKNSLKAGPGKFDLQKEIRLKRPISVALALVLIFGVGTAQFLQWQSNIEVGIASGLLERISAVNLNALQKRTVGQEILRRLDKAASKSRNNFEIDSLKGSAHFFLGNPELAKENYEKAAQNIPSPELMTNLAAAYMALGELDNAESKINLALAYDDQTEKAREALNFLEGRKQE
jgi:tetratricopeptide (TPR) repeat protein